jgi:hypothetical protein
VFNEWVARMLALRSKTLEAGIRNLLSDPNLMGTAKELYEHSLIKGLYKQGRIDKLLNRQGRPSYISPQTFALALMDIVAPADPAKGPKSFQEVRATVNNLPGNLKEALLPLLDTAEGDLKKARENIENWFDEAMKRVTGWYTRHAAVITLCFALVVTIALNADTIMMAERFSQDNALRAVIVEYADKTVAESEEPPDMTIAEVLTTTKELELPFSWSQNEPGSLDEPDEIISKIFGLLITALAISLGAPFWFDILNKIVNLRRTGKQLEQAPEAEGERPVTFYLRGGEQEE